MKGRQAFMLLISPADLGKPAGKGVRGATSMRLAAKYGAPFLSLFDIHLDCSSEEADIDVIADQLLGMAQRQQAAMAAACGGAGELSGCWWDMAAWCCTAESHGADM